MCIYIYICICIYEWIKRLFHTWKTRKRRWVGEKDWVSLYPEVQSCIALGLRCPGKSLSSLPGERVNLLSRRIVRRRSFRPFLGIDRSCGKYDCQDRFGFYMNNELAKYFISRGVFYSTTLRASDFFGPRNQAYKHTINSHSLSPFVTGLPRRTPGHSRRPILPPSRTVVTYLADWRKGLQE